jgi:hypothetical protein
VHAKLACFSLCGALLSSSQPARAGDAAKEPDLEAEQAEREKQTVLPPLPELTQPPAPAWQRRLEIGVDLAYLSRPLAQALAPSETYYPAAPGFGVHLRWNVLSWLRFHPYFLRSVHDVNLPAGSLQSGTPTSILAAADYGPLTVETFVFGAKLAPTLPLGERTRAWASVGVGWGRFQFRPQAISERGGEFELPRRNGVFAEVPVGLGIAYDIVPRWVALSYEVVYASAFGQSGAAHEVVQAVDADGATRDVGPLGAVEGSFAQTIGLSLIL